MEFSLNVHTYLTNWFQRYIYFIQKQQSDISKDVSKRLTLSINIRNVKKANFGNRHANYRKNSDVS